MGAKNRWYSLMSQVLEVPPSSGDNNNDSSQVTEQELLRLLDTNQVDLTTEIINALTYLPELPENVEVQNSIEERLPEGAIKEALQVLTGVTQVGRGVDDMERLLDQIRNFSINMTRMECCT